MKKLLLLCALLFTLLSAEESEDFFPLSTPDQIASLTSNRQHLIGGLISPVSGQLCLHYTDLIARGAQEIALHRFFVPPPIPDSFHKKKDWDIYYLNKHLKQNYQGWTFLPHLRVKVTPYHKLVRLTEPSGISLDFDASGLVSSPLGINNAGQERPTGKSDLRNTRITYLEDGRHITVHAADGVTREYRFLGASKPILGSLFCYLDKEILPNGKILKYHYATKEYHYVTQGELVRIDSLDPKEKYVYASLSLEGTPKKGRCHFTTSSKTSATYEYQNRIIPVTLKQKHRGGERKTHESCHFPPLLTTVSSPFYRREININSERCFLTEHRGKEVQFECHYSGIHADPPQSRIHALLFPIGPNNAYEKVYTLTNQAAHAGHRQGLTTVLHPDGTKTLFHISKNLLLEEIHSYQRDGSLVRKKLFTWTDNNWLQAIELRDRENHLIYRRSFAFDRFGNPALETFTGDLTGAGGEESYLIKREFSQDGLHLLLREEEDCGKILTFKYLPKTNLVAEKRTQAGDQVLLRETFTYDECNNLIRSVVDDGVTKKITRYHLRQEQPFLHMPEWREEKYLNEGEETLLKRTHFTYDSYGFICREEVYDANNLLAYTIDREYNEAGDLLSETNPLGQRATYAYDAKGLCTASNNFSGRIQKTNVYDAQNRLRELTERGCDGAQHTSSYQYDAEDHLIQKTDPFNNTTRYAYDPIAHKVSKTESPPLFSPDGRAVAVTTLSTYDALGNESSKTDGNGNTTHTRYTAYGSPAEIVHPDGGKEVFRYATNSGLESYTDQEGMITRYVRDVLGRVLSKTYANGLAEETFTYHGALLTQETDKEENVTHYAYDGAGRKFCQETCGKVTEYAYDSLGRVESIRENTSFTYFTRDLLDRILEERKTDAQGTLLYEIAYGYDAAGNQNCITRSINGEEAAEIFTYDSFDRQIEHRDALGALSKTFYDESHSNRLGQKVLQTTHLSPKNISTIKTYDAHGHIAGKEIADANRALLSHCEMVYDPCSNLLQQKDHIYEQGTYRSTQVIGYSYTSQNRLAATTRALGSPEERTTTYSYTPNGKRAAKTFPDGITLIYHYDRLGFLETLLSSDGAIHHTFTHDHLGTLLSCTDELLNLTIQREVDPFGNVVKETFPNGLVLEKEYDLFDRTVSVTLPDRSQIVYSYDPLFLRSVTRTSSTGMPLYTHHYETYDLSGNLISEHLIGNLGNVSHTFDLKGRKNIIASTYFSQSNFYDEEDNLLTTLIDGSSHTYTYDPLSQLTSENDTFYNYDSLYNRTRKNDKIASFNELNELLLLDTTHCTFDLRGNQITKTTPDKTLRFTYDPLNRLIETESETQKIHFTYDPLDRRISKTIYTATPYGWKETDREYYLYDGNQELGAFTPAGAPKQLRILGRAQQHNPAPIALELEGQLFAPLLDAHNNIVRLLSLSSRALATSYEFTAFGEQIQPLADEVPFNPWRYACKRLDPELNLLYFGKRYYDPELARWLTTDPAGFIDSRNLYQYVFNNPFLYRDPDGENAIALVLSVLEIAFGAGAAITSPIWAPAAIVTTIAAIGVYAGYEAYRYYQRTGSIPPICSRNVWDLPSVASKNLSKSGSVPSGKGVGGKTPNYNNKQGRRKPSGTKKEGTPKSREVQQKQSDDAKKEIEKNLGRKLSRDEEREFHDYVTKQNYNYQELVEEGFWLFHE